MIVHQVGHWPRIGPTYFELKNWTIYNWPPHPHLECRGPKKGRAIPLLTLRAFVAYKKGENLPTIYNFVCKILLQCWPYQAVQNKRLFSQVSESASLSNAWNSVQFVVCLQTLNGRDFTHFLQWALRYNHTQGILINHSYLDRLDA